MKKFPIVVGSIAGALVGVSCIAKMIKAKREMPKYEQLPLDVRLHMMSMVLNVPVSEVKNILADDKERAEELIKSESLLTTFRREVYGRYGLTKESVTELEKRVGVDFVKFAEYMSNYGYTAEDLADMTLNDMVYQYYQCRDLDAVADDGVEDEEDFDTSFKVDEPKGGTLKAKDMEDFSKYMNPPEDTENSEGVDSKEYRSGHTQVLERYLEKFLYPEDIENFFRYLDVLPDTVFISLQNLRNHTMSSADKILLNNSKELQSFKNKGLHTERIASMPEDAWNEMQAYLALFSK